MNTYRGGEPTTPKQLHVTFKITCHCASLVQEIYFSLSQFQHHDMYSNETSKQNIIHANYHWHRQNTHWNVGMSDSHTQLLYLPRMFNLDRTDIS